ncbi:hypothetical protein ABVT39_000771 [Epinephelus coioides]
MAQKGVQLDRETFSCSICLDLLKDPLTIPCGHSYCMNCIKTHWDGEDEKEIHSCPQCRQTFTPRPLVDPSDKLQEKICSHDEVMKMLCLDHNTVSAAAERTERQRELEVSRQNIQQRIQDREKYVKLLQQEVEAINCSAYKTVEGCEEIIADLICLMEKRRSDVKQQVRSQQKTEPSSFHKCKFSCSKPCFVVFLKEVERETHRPSLPRGQMSQKRVKLNHETSCCSICLDLLKEPVTVPCGHSYCMDCIQSFLDKEDLKKSSSCAQSSKSSTPRPVLETDTMLAVSAAAERAERQRELEVSLKKIEQRIQNAEKDMKVLRLEMEKINDSADKAVEDSDEIFTELIRLIKKKSSDVKQQVRSQQKTEEVEAINRSADKAVEDSEKIFTELIRLMEERRSDVKQQVRSQQKTEIYSLNQHGGEVRELTGPIHCTNTCCLDQSSNYFQF